MTRWCRSFVSLGLVLVLFGASTCAAPATLPTSGISIVQVVRDDHYPPYSFLNEHGASQGGSADLGRLGEVKTGEKGEITVLPWARARESMKSDPDEVIETMFYADKRAALYDFSELFAEQDGDSSRFRTRPGQNRNFESLNAVSGKTPIIKISRTFPEKRG